MEPVHSDTALRDHLANERTFLAWTRTALGCAALSLLIDRVGLIGGQGHKPGISGAILLLAGVLFQFLGLWRYMVLNRKIVPVAGQHSITWSVAVSGIMAAVSFAIASLLHLV